MQMYYCTKRKQSVKALLNGGNQTEITNYTLKRSSFHHLTTPCDLKTSVSLFPLQMHED
ncbi:hypothetical protein HanIR_Chr02g0065931 [Helianthus annuus]|nr:hypothetical protein HanIR_Chr02g0065931 [Helianthus annuus]